MNSNPNDGSAMNPGALVSLKLLMKRFLPSGPTARITARPGFMCRLSIEALEERPFFRARSSGMLFNDSAATDTRQDAKTGQWRVKLRFLDTSDN